MSVEFDPATIARFRTMSAREAYESAREAVYRMGAHSSEDFLEVCQCLVDEGILNWDQLEEFER